VNAREALTALPKGRREAYLREHSGLPGPRANLELAQVAADVGDERTFRRWLAGPDEYLALCAAIGIGRLVAEGHDALWVRLREAAEDGRWRVREGVAMGLQRVGDVDADRMLDEIETWLDGPALVRRAAVAGICEPRLLRRPETARRALTIVETATASLLSESDRRAEDVRVLRQALGYCWSVAVAALPADGVAAFVRMENLDDPDIAWICRENRKKKRLLNVLNDGGGGTLA
jgi:hypothetical protein